MAAGKERIIICAECGAEVITRYSRTRFCLECSARRNMGSIMRSNERQRKERMENEVEPDEPIHFCDSPEKIQMCLNCKRKECTNCLAGGVNPFSSKERRKQVYFEDIRDELIKAVKQGLKVSVIARKFGCADTSVRRWINQLKEEGVLE